MLHDVSTDQTADALHPNIYIALTNDGAAAMSAHSLSVMSVVMTGKQNKSLYQ